MAVYDKAYELARELKESAEYKEYQAAKEAIEGNEPALQILRDYWQQQLSIQTALLTGREPDEKNPGEFQQNPRTHKHARTDPEIHASRTAGTHHARRYPENP